MALTQCPDCGKDVSTSAPTCPGCGAPIALSPGKPQRGDRIPYSDQEVAVMLSKKPKTSHLLHLILSIITIGVWSVVWLLVGVNNAIEAGRIDRRIAKGKKLK